MARGPKNKTVQSKIPTSPRMPCKRECGRFEDPNRKDGLCGNCGHFADHAANKGKTSGAA